MNLSERQYRQRISLGQTGNSLVKLIAITLVMFVLLAFMKAIWYFQFPKEVAPVLFEKNILGWFALPASFDVFLQRPWTLLTHMFVHDNIWKVFANMLWLWSFGYILQELTGNKKVIPVFIYGAVGGAVAFLLAYQFSPSLSNLKSQVNLVGASAGVMAISIAATTISPGYRIFPMIGGGIPLWALTALFVITDLATVSISDTGNLLAHLTGALMGFLFVIFMKQGKDWGGWMNRFFDWAGNLFNPDKVKAMDLKDELFYKSSMAPYKKTPNVTPQRIDEILDKINQKGFQHLTDEEKDLLKRASEEEL